MQRYREEIREIESAHEIEKIQIDEKHQEEWWLSLLWHLNNLLTNFKSYFYEFVMNIN